MFTFVGIRTDRAPWPVAEFKSEFQESFDNGVWGNPVFDKESLEYRIKNLKDAGRNTYQEEIGLLELQSVLTFKK